MLPSRDTLRRQPWPASQLHAAAGTFKWVTKSRRHRHGGQLYAPDEASRAPRP